MKAVVYTEFGPPEVLRIQERPKPAPKADELLIRVRSTSVNYGDLAARAFRSVAPRDFNMPLLFWLGAKMHFGFSTPRVTVLGNEFSGDVEAVGRNVTAFRQGDEVFGYRGQAMGAYAEYLCIPETGCVAAKPSNLSHEEAGSATYGAVMALSLLRKANLEPGQNVLILGASGSIGSAAVQLTKHRGARVTGVCSTRNVERVRVLGADRVLDYTHEDVTQSNERYDLIVDVLGKGPVEGCQRVLGPNGVHLFVSFKAQHLLRTLRTSRSKGRKVVCALASATQRELVAAGELFGSGALRSHVDRCFPLERAADAHRYAEQGQAQGNVVITV